MPCADEHYYNDPTSQTNLKIIPEVHVFIATSLDGFIARKDGGLVCLNIVKVEGEDYCHSKFMSSIDTLILRRNTYEVVRSFGEWPYSGKKVYHDGVKQFYLDGGNLIRQGLEEGIIQRITLNIIPIILGDGISLFGDIENEIKLQNMNTRSFLSGLVQLTYYLN